MIVLAGGLDVNRAAGLDREALERVRQKRQSQPADAITAEGEADLGVRPADEVDSGRRAGLVHRHRRSAVARQPVPAPERLPERGADGRHHVLDRVMLVHVHVSAGDRLQVEPAVEGELGQQVVEEPDARVHPRALAPVERERDAQRRLSGRSDDERRPHRRRSGVRTEGREQPVVFGRQPRRDPDRTWIAAHDEPLLLEPLGQRGPVLDRHVDEVCVRARAVEPGGQEGIAHPLALGDLRLDVEHRIAQSGGGDPRCGSRDRRGSPATVELRDDPARRDEISDPQRGEAERLRQAPDRDQIGQLPHERHHRLTRVLEVRLVDNDHCIR